jgi:uncharacterized coiled-coil protein SlyX
MRPPKWLNELRRQLACCPPLLRSREGEQDEEDERSVEAVLHDDGVERIILQGSGYITIVLSKNKSSNGFTNLRPIISNQAIPFMVNPESYRPSTNSPALPVEGSINLTPVREPLIESPALPVETIAETSPRRRANAISSKRINMVSGLMLVICLATIIQPTLANPLSGPELFNKHQKMDKLILKNQIGYHFKKVVREVSQELFVSRRIDVSTLFSGIYALKQTSQEVTRYCQSLGDGIINSKGVFGSKNNIQELSNYVYIKYPETASFAEAKARCESRKMQLPEVYSMLQHEHLASFLRANKLRMCFAGLQPDVPDAIFRFISTGFPMWRTPHAKVYTTDQNALGVDALIDDFNAKFFYGDNNKMYARLAHPSILTDTNFKLGDTRYRDSVKNFTQIIGPIVCQTKWDGVSYDHFKTDDREAHGLNIKSVTKRATSSSDSETSASASLRELCSSIASEASDLTEDMSNKLRDLLSLVDISVQLDKNEDPKVKREALDETALYPTLGKYRQKRFSFLAKFIFKTGLKLVWSLFGFIEKMRLERRLYKMEKSIASNTRLSQNNQQAIQNMSLIVASNSIAIDQLRVTTNALTQRMNILEGKVSSLTHTVAGIANNVEDILKLSYIANLVSRIKQSMDNGYESLKDVIHCSLLGQTSPSLLPTDQLKLVQLEVNKVSTGILDTDFARMQSIIVSDPTDSHLLLVVINMAALSRTEEELVTLIPVPQFESKKAYAPTLDYDTIIVNQLSRTYSVLKPQEEYDCLFRRCYVSDVERSIDQKTCGIPQLFDQQLDGCIYEEVVSTGVYVQPMLPDGVLFALREEVSTQLFCKDNSEIGNIKKLNGSGIMQIPNGCTLSLTDKLGKNTKVKGQPLYRLIDAEDMTLVMNGPLKSAQPYNGRNSTHKKVTTDDLITSQLDPVVQHVQSVNGKVKTQSHFVFGLMGTIGVILVIIMIVIFLMYKYSKKHFLKIYDLRDRIAELAKFIHSLSEFRDRISKKIHPPLSALKNRAKAAIFRSPLKARIAMHDLKEKALHFRSSSHHAISHHDEDQEPTEDEEPVYVSMGDLRTMDPPSNLANRPTFSTFSPSPRRVEFEHRVPYPSLSDPSLNHEELENESEEVEAFCKKFPMPTKNEQTD